VVAAFCEAYEIERVTKLVQSECLETVQDAAVGSYADVRDVVVRADRVPTAIVQTHGQPDRVPKRWILEIRAGYAVHRAEHRTG
jgi:hypothetical protein